jgi:hypothetical protein
MQQGDAKLQADALRLGHGEVNFLSADERRRPARPTMRCSAARGSCGSNRRSHCSAAERTTVLSLERDADEAAASLLGHCLRVGSGSRRSLRFLDQNWLEGLDRSAVGHFTAVVKTLRYRDLLNVAIERVRTRPGPELDQFSSFGRGQSEMGDLVQDYIGLSRAVQCRSVPN